MIYNQTTIKIYHTNTNKKNEFLTVDISSLTKEKQLLFLEMSKYPNENTEFKERFYLDSYEEFILNNSIEKDGIYTINKNINIEEKLLKSIERNKAMIGFELIQKTLSKEDFKNYYFNILPKNENRKGISTLTFVSHLLRFKNIDTDLFELRHIQNIIKTEKINDIKNHITYLGKKEYIDTTYKEARLSLPNETIITYVNTNEKEDGSILLTNGSIVKIEQEAKARSQVVVRNNKPLGINPKTGKEIYNEWFMDKSTFEQKYGELPISVSKYEKYKKTEILTVVEITEGLFKILEEKFKLEKDGDSLRLPVSWGDYMKFEVGDYITSKGYTIDKEALDSTYILNELEEMLKLEDISFLKKEIIDKLEKRYFNKDIIEKVNSLFTDNKLDEVKNIINIEEERRKSFNDKLSNSFDDKLFKRFGI